MGSFSGCFFAIFIVVSGSAMAASAQVNAADMHIEVIVRPARVADQDSPPPPTLKASELRLSQNGHELPFHLLRPGAYPQHLLVITARQLRCLAIPVPVIKRMLGKGWAVRVADAEGTATAELTSEADLRSACGTIQHVPIRGLLQDTAQQDGRRAVLLSGTVTPELIGTLPSIPEIYWVDGGVQLRSESPLLRVPQPSPVSPSELTATSAGFTLPCHEVGGRIAPNDPCNITVGTTYRKSGFRGGINHEKSVETALKAIDRAGDRYYEMTFHSTDNDPVELALHHTGPMSVTVTMYSLPNAAPNVPPRRVLTTGDLIVRQQ
ncbi:MAG TPA: hypothetical protein VFW30_04845 [Bryocella sp.]|nr:hypothetical protein [Bryocella sp.]